MVFANVPGTFANGAYWPITKDAIWRPHGLAGLSPGHQQPRLPPFFGIGFFVAITGAAFFALAFFFAAITGSPNENARR